MSNGKTLSGVTPLYIASQDGHIPVCTLLIEKNAQFNQQRNDGFTPLMGASWSGHVDVCEYLLQNNAAINLKSKSSDTALTCAYFGKKYNVCKLLLKHGVNVNDVGNDVKSILDTINDSNDQNDESINDANEEAEKAQEKLPRFVIKKAIDQNRKRLEKIEESNITIHQSKHLRVKKQKKKNDHSIQAGFLKQKTNNRTTPLSSRQTLITRRQALTGKPKYRLRGKN